MSGCGSVSVFSDSYKYSRTVGQQELNKIVLHCMSILVKNAIGTSRWEKPSTGESSWLEYWENHVGHKATHCGAIDCRSSYNLVGAHVKKPLEMTAFTSHPYVAVAISALALSGLIPS